MTTVLLAMDNAPESLAAARRAHELFGADATYLAVHVSNDQPDWAAAPMRWGGVYSYPAAAPYPLVEDEITPQPDTARDQARSTARGLTTEAGIAATPVGEAGDPATAILAAADEHGADVIVTGVSDKSWWRRLVDPSVSKELVRESPLPVLVVGSADPPS